MRLKLSNSPRNFSSGRLEERVCSSARREGPDRSGHLMRVELTDSPRNFSGDRLEKRACSSARREGPDRSGHLMRVELADSSQNFSSDRDSRFRTGRQEKKAASSSMATRRWPGTSPSRKRRKGTTSTTDGPVDGDDFLSHRDGHFSEGSDPPDHAVCFDDGDGVGGA